MSDPLIIEDDPQASPASPSPTLKIEDDPGFAGSPKLIVENDPEASKLVIEDDPNPPSFLGGLVQKAREANEYLRKDISNTAEGLVKFPYEIGHQIGTNIDVVGQKAEQLKAQGLTDEQIDQALAGERLGVLKPIPEAVGGFAKQVGAYGGLLGQEAFEKAWKGSVVGGILSLFPFALKGGAGIALEDHPSPPPDPSFVQTVHEALKEHLEEHPPTPTPSGKVIVPPTELPATPTPEPKPTGEPAPLSPPSVNYPPLEKESFVDRTQKGFTEEMAREESLNAHLADIEKARTEAIAPGERIIAEDSFLRPKPPEELTVTPPTTESVPTGEPSWVKNQTPENVPGGEESILEGPKEDISVIESPQKDLLGAVRRLGGIGLKKAEAEGLAGEARMFSPKEALTTGLFKKEGGKSFNDMLTSLKEEGLMPEEATTNDFINALDADSRKRGNVLAFGSEAGAVNLGGMKEGFEERVNSVKDYIASREKEIKFSGDLQKDKYTLDNENEIDRIQSEKLTEALRATGIKPKDLESIYHWIQNKKEPITPEQLKVYNEHIKPLLDLNEKKFNELKKREVPIEKEGYIHRITKDRGGWIERLIRGFKGISETGGLRKTTPEFKHRVMLSLEDDAGNRKVVSVKQGRVVGWDKGNAEYLGNTKTRGSEWPNFKDKNGKQWKIGDATDKEIEANTSVRYHHNAFVSAIDSYMNLRRVERNVQYLENLKDNLDFKKMSYKAGESEGNPPADWKSTVLPQLRGYMFPKRVAEVLDDAWGKRSAFDLGDTYSKINKVMRDSIFFNFLMHVPNESVHFIVERGLSRWVNPADYPAFFKALVRSYKANMEMNKDYIDLLHKGTSESWASVRTKDLEAKLLNTMGLELAKGEILPDISKYIGKLNPYRLSQVVTWFTNDFLQNALIFEKMEPGPFRKAMTMEKAAGKVSEHFPDYRIGSRAWGSKWIPGGRFTANLLKSDFAMFGRYHFGMWKSYFKMAEGLVDGAKQAITGKGEEGRWGGVKEMAEASDKLAMLGVVMYILYPAIDGAIKKISGNPKAELRKAGAATGITNVSKLVRSRIQRGEFYGPDISQFIQSIATPSPGFKLLGEVMLGFRDPYSGKPLSPGQVAAQTISPISYGQRISSGQLDWKRALASQAGISLRKSTPSEQTFYSMSSREGKEDIENKLKGLLSEGKRNEAVKAMWDFNKRLKQTYEDSLKEGGDKRDIKKYFVKLPGPVAMQNYKVRHPK